MTEFNFNNKIFSLTENSENGKVSSETIFKYKQEGHLVTANYYGGTIKYGKIIASLEENKLNMLYQCITTENELKAGKAIANISLAKHNKIKLTLHWEWLNGKKETGVSEYIEQ
ncbi:hypothetical protein Q4Q35_00620 [Flavivirga aquimarina]|uniref:N-acetylglutamate synthase n=1 Tax=Flavivirga aquimarina TaxID=2027862 RepID=A0ABT8W5A9_9FLAO|nr:hypothetical protein [Flavivirga aquimarina]MDO5968297.1 hypothetical protein [Flavivirga aquimarina]